MKHDGQAPLGRDDRVGALERRLAALEQQRRRAERWAGLLVTLALLAVSGSLMLLTEKLSPDADRTPAPLAAAIPRRSGGPLSADWREKQGRPVNRSRRPCKSWGQAAVGTTVATTGRNPSDHSLMAGFSS